MLSQNTIWLLALFSVQSVRGQASFGQELGGSSLSELLLHHTKTHNFWGLFVDFS